MNKNILFVHSAGNQEDDEGSSKLLSYIKHSLSTDFSIRAPVMPDPENPRYENWKSKIIEELDDLENIIFIGHSLGASVILKLISEVSLLTQILGLHLIAAPYWGMNGWKIEEFLLRKNFEQNISQTLPVFLYHSSEDEWVPFSHVVQYSGKLKTSTVRKINGKEHNFSNGLPVLIHDIKNLKYGGSI